MFPRSFVDCLFPCRPSVVQLYHRSFHTLSPHVPAPLHPRRPATTSSRKRKRTRLPPRITQDSPIGINTNCPHRAPFLHPCHVVCKAHASPLGSVDTGMGRCTPRPAMRPHPLRVHLGLTLTLTSAGASQCRVGWAGGDRSAARGARWWQENPAVRARREGVWGEWGKEIQGTSSKNRTGGKADIRRGRDDVPCGEKRRLGERKRVEEAARCPAPGTGEAAPSTTMEAGAVGD